MVRGDRNPGARRHSGARPELGVAPGFLFCMSKR